MTSADKTAIPGDIVTPDEDGLILLGYLTRPHGHKGAIRLHPVFDDSESFDGLKTRQVYIKPGIMPGLGMAVKRPAVWRTLTISSHFHHQQGLVLTFDECPDMNHAEVLRGMEVYVEQQYLWDLPAGKYYAWQVVGLTVVNAETGDDIGEVLSLRDGNYNDYLEVSRPGQKPALIPYIPQFIEKVDLEARRITAQIPEGLLDL